MSLRGREDKQPPRLLLVLGSAEPIVEHESEAVLRVSIPLSGREAIQPPRLHLVLRSAVPLGEHVSEAALRISILLDRKSVVEGKIRTV